MTRRKTEIHNSKGSAPQHKARSLFGRRQGRPLSQKRQEALDTLLPKLHISAELLTQHHTTRPAEIFPKSYSKYWLEIGFGYGEHVRELAQRHKNTAYLAAEPFVNGVAAFLKDSLKETKDPPLDNIRILMDDGLILARSLAPQSIDGIYILNPDPWHKKRHHKRRIINQENLGLFSKILKPQGQLIMTSDVEDLASWMCTHASNHPDFQWQAQTKKDWSIPPEDWITTRYEQKGAKGAKKMVYLLFKRK